MSKSPIRLLPFLVIALLVSCTGGCGSNRETDRVSGDSPADSAVDSVAIAESTAAAAEVETVKPLKPRMLFPAVDLLTLEGETVNSHELLRGHDSLVIFLQIGCESCEEVLEVWKQLADRVPPELNVIGITEEEPELAAAYAESSGFPFPLYCDDRGIFGTEHQVVVFPSMVGVPTDGLIAYVGKPVTVEFTPAKAWAMLKDVKERREKAARETEGGP